MATIYIDNKPYEVNPDDNLLQACLSLGFNIPYFCWHPAMGSVGACRQCAVKQFKDENDTKGKIIMACMTPAADGTRISIDDPEAKTFRASVIEWLMLNHPHDCPVCDEGGECHLQDMTVMTGHAYRRTRFRKRTYRNQDLGPFINHEMNRCIQCYRCVRYYRDYAGGRDLNVFSVHDHVYFGRAHDGTLENEFSGNLVEVCPTGVFTDKTLARHYTRKWDLQDAPSICIHCGVGCNTSPRARYGMLRRIVNRFHFDINGYFLCDRGRFGYEFVNSERRIGSIRPSVPQRQVIEDIASVIKNGRKVIGIGSPRASLEANFALRMLVGADRFFSGVRAEESLPVAKVAELLRRSPCPIASVHDIEVSDAVLVLGEDLINTAPRLALAVRQSVRRKSMETAARMNIPAWHDYAVRTLAQDERSPLVIATPYETALDEIASESYRGAPEDLARLGYAIACAIDPQAPRVEGLGREEAELAERIAGILKGANRPAVIFGTGCRNAALIEAGANVALALARTHPDPERVRLALTVPECNSAGLALMEAKDLDAAFEAARSGADAIIVLENDLYRRSAVQQVDEFLRAARTVVLDSLENETTAKAETILPAGTFAESEGTLVNSEGRAQRYFKVMPPRQGVLESWRWLREIAIAAGRLNEDSWRSLDAVIAAIEAELPQFQEISKAAPAASFRIAGQKIPRQLHRYSGRTAMMADITVHEPAPPRDPDSALAFSMEGYQGPPPAGLASFFWAPGWNSYQAVNKYQSEIGGPLRGGPAGSRLGEGKRTDDISYSSRIPEPFRSRDGKVFVVPAFRIFGSEELSMHAPGIAARAEKPFLEVNPSDAEKLGISAEQEVALTFGAVSRSLAIRMNPSLPPGVAALPAGLPESAGIPVPAWARITGR
ncbi:MAG: NADH-quinone oxidoreductase subunit NuoG [Acidobacteria bacterium]|nr:NADH-quinone oxidoreductase subunit NuoG [Acidobacteriota bacterium]